MLKTKNKLIDELNRKFSITLLKRVPVSLMVYLYRNRDMKKKCFSNKISKELDVTTSGVLDYIKKFEKKGYLYREKTVKRKRHIFLTKKGTKLAEALNDVLVNSNSF